jgi:DNA repair protein RecO (recombination protein O)
MAIKKAEAIILHSRKHGETSKILTLYTREFGKMSAMAKGARGARSKYLGTLETFNHVSLVFYQKQGRQLQYLSDASIEHSFPSVHAQLGKMALAAVACEIIDKSEQDDQSHPELFKLIVDTLAALNQYEAGLRNIIRAFQIQFISLAGFEPELDACHYCGKSDVDDFNYLSMQHGFYSCDHCGYQDRTVRTSGYVIQLLRWLNRIPVTNAPQAKILKPIGEEIDNILLPYLQTHIEALTNLKSVAHLKNLAHHLK